MIEQDFSGGELVDGRFRLTRSIGVGGFGTVWACIDETDGREVAIKILHDAFAEHPGLVNRFQREIEVLSRLDHPNIAGAIAAGRDVRCRYLAMQYVPGRTLFEDLVAIARRGDTYSVREILDICEGLAGALDTAHAAGIIHRDLKPANVMIRREGGRTIPTVLDFGIAKVAVELGDQTTLGRRLGTLMYMSPEQLRGEAVDARTDVFSLGVILFEMLTLRRPFARNVDGQPLHFSEDSPSLRDVNGHHAVMKRIAVESRPKPSELRSGLDADVDRLVLRALDHAPKNRFATAGALLAALREALSAGGMPVVEPKLEPKLDDTAIAAGPSEQTRTKLLPPRARELGLLLWVPVFGAVVAGSAIVYLKLTEPIEIRAQRIVEAEAETREEPVVQPRVEQVAKVEKVEKVEKTTPKKAVRVNQPRVPPPPPPAPQPKTRAASLRAELEGSEDPAVIGRVAKALEAEAAKLGDREAELSIRRCATLSAASAEKRELLRCIDKLEAAAAP